MVVLRLLHIVFGVFWAGSTFFLTLVLEPRLHKLGPAIQRPVMGGLMPVLTPFMLVSSLVTIGAGIGLTLSLRGGSLSTFLSTGWGWAILIGFVAATANFAIGFGVITPTGLRMKELAHRFAGRTPKPEETSQLDALSQRITFLSRVNFVLVLIAVGAMAAARYV